MKRVLVYSHDTFGLGNIRRMLAVVEHLVENDPSLCALVLSGSPMLQSFRPSPRIDHVKLPCLERDESGRYGSRFLDVGTESLVALRASLILETVRGFAPDLILVDKKPLGVQNELAPLFAWLERRARRPRVALVLREILDEAAVTRGVWRRNRHHDTIARHYDSVLVLGPRELYDTAEQYAFPSATRQRLSYCGYIAKPAPSRSPAEVRRELDADGLPLVVVTAGGGRDGFAVLDTALDTLPAMPALRDARMLLIAGPELERTRLIRLRDKAARRDGASVMVFTDEPMSYLRAADLVVSMAGYNATTELLSLGARAVLVPRVRPTREQAIRAERLAALGVFECVMPDVLDVASLSAAMHRALGAPPGPRRRAALSLSGLDRVQRIVTGLLHAGPRLAERPAVEPVPLDSLRPRAATRAERLRASV